MKREIALQRMESDFFDKIIAYMQFFLYLCGLNCYM
jgi:hypothetical protein